MIRVIGVLKDQESFDAVIAKQEGREPSHYHGTFATHPDNDTRLQQVVGEASSLTVANPSENKSEFLQQTEGLVFNDNVEEGVVRNNKFMHPGLGIALTFPPEWSVKNSHTQLVSLSPKSDATIQLKIDGKPSGTATEYAHHAIGNGASVESLELEQLHAAIGSANNALLGVIYHDRKAFLIQCNTKTAEAMSVQREAMKATIRSFHVLTEEERKQIKPLVIELTAARKDDTYAKLAQRSPLGKNAESYLRLINAQYPQGEPAAGQTIKIIE
jgi:predicted Zn-dependent protease